MTSERGGTEIVPGVVPSPEDDAMSRAVRTAGFRLLLERGGPVAVGDVAGAAGLPEDDVAAVLADLVGRGRARLDGDGALVGIAGLSVVATRHRLRLGERERFTWCAVDALGILAAAATGGRVQSLPPDGDEPVVVAFDGARPEPSDAVVWLADIAASSAPVDDWCPLVNLFPDAGAARRWAGVRGGQGRIVPVAEAAADAGEDWRPLFDPPAGT